MTPMRTPAAFAKSAQRRKDKRFKQRNRTSITLQGSEQGLRGASEAKAFTYDLSLGGTLIQSEEAFPVGTRIQLRIVLSRTMASLSLDGEVKWVRRHASENTYEMGVEFLHDRPQSFMSLMKELYEIKKPDLSQDAASPAAPPPPRVNRS
jgi:c-di-GMP-binding flagellar brake protein YcgR